jgi:hypothetical protein
MALLLPWATALADTGRAVSAAPAQPALKAATKPAAKTAARTATPARAGTAGRGKAATPRQAQEDSAAIAALANSVWRVSCELCDRQRFTPYYLILRDDMVVGSNLAAPVAWDFRTSPGAWSVRNGELFIEWRQGQDVQTYVVATLAQGWLAGLNQDNQQQVLTQVVQRRKTWEAKPPPETTIDLDLPD